MSAQLQPIQKESLARRFAQVRALTESICAPLETEDYLPQPIVDVSPPRWHIAHVTWFFEEMILKPFAPAYQVFDAQYGYLFNSYYNSLGTRTLRHRRGDLARPTVREIFAYRQHVDAAMREYLRDETTLDKAARALVVLGLNHEQQHQELLLTDLKYIFGCNPLFPVYRADDLREDAGASETAAAWLDVAGGNYEIGYAGDGFHFDNELGRHKVWLDDFQISNRLVTNGEWLEFIADGGYKNFRLWHAEGWDWVNENQIASPLYWYETDGAWQQFTLAGLRELNLNAPVCHVSFYEAAAFAAWRDARLPTEFEWETANNLFAWGHRWEWTQSAYLPYPRFTTAAGAVGEYNGKFMANQMVLRGASVATSPGHSRPTYRNFFHPPLRWQFTGVRLARWSEPLA